MIKGQYDENKTHFRDLRKGGGLRGSDEFFTRLVDIEAELEHYPVEQFEGKRVLCPCDTPDSNFVRFFIDNFSRLGIKHLTATSIDGQRVDYDGIGLITTRIDNGDVFGADVQSLLKETDIVVTNPPFSSKIDFLQMLLAWGGKFLFIGPLIGISTLAFFNAWRSGKIRINGSLQYFLDHPSGNLRKTAVPCRWYTNMTRETTPRPIPCVPYSDDKAMWAE